MALSTYSDLRTSIASHAWRTGDVDFEAATVDLVALAHSRLNRELRCRQMEDSASIVMTNGAGPLPTGYLEFIEVKDGNTPAGVLSVADPGFGDAQYSAASGGRAKYFAILGSTIQTYPASSSNLTMRFYKKIDALEEDNDTNWVLTEYPGLYLYGSLVEASAYMMDDARIAVWAQMYERLRQSLLSEDLRAKFARSSSRVRGPTP